MPDFLVQQIPRLLVIAMLVGILVVAYALFRMICMPNPTRTFAKVYDGITVATQPFPGSVNVRFHTYHGFLIYALQTSHNVWAQPNDAMLLLRRLHRFNMTRGLFAYGALVIPILSWFNYRSEAKRLQKQTVQE